MSTPHIFRECRKCWVGQVGKDCRKGGMVGVALVRQTCSMASGRTGKVWGVQGPAETFWW